MNKQPFVVQLTLWAVFLGMGAACTSASPIGIEAETVADLLTGTIEDVGTDHLLMQAGGELAGVDVPADAVITLNQRRVPLRQLSRGDWVSVVLAPGGGRRALRVDAMKGWKVEASAPLND
jgi:hypothetical protein